MPVLIHSVFSSMDGTMPIHMDIPEEALCHQWALADSPYLVGKYKNFSNFVFQEGRNGYRSTDPTNHKPYC